jgi:hypothetical protein
LREFRLATEMNYAALVPLSLAMTAVTAGHTNMMSAKVVIEPTSGFEKNTPMLPLDESSD